MFSALHHCFVSSDGIWAVKIPLQISKDFHEIFGKKANKRVVLVSVAYSYQRQLQHADSHHARVLISRCFSALRYNVSIVQNQRENVASADQFLRSVLCCCCQVCIVLRCLLSV